MNHSIKKSLLSFVAAIALVSLGSCGWVAWGDRLDSPSVSESPTATPSATVSVAPTSPPVQSLGTHTVTVTIYEADDDCQELLPRSIDVPEENSLEATVGQIIEGWNSSDFRFAGYRVDVEAGVATVDFRVAPNSDRVIISLSSCERFALFGSVSKTLKNNPQWQIAEVQFTERGNEISF